MANRVFQQGVAGTGVLYSSGTVDESPRDFLTWHDKLPYRIWIHSRLTDSGYKQAGVEVEWLGTKSLAISDTEYKFRLDLVKVRSGDFINSDLGPSTFRNIALGQLLEEHVKLITTQRARRTRVGKRSINLIKDYELEKFPDTTIEFKKHKKAIQSQKKLGASNLDSILIAFVYAEQCSNGSKMPAMLTAQVLGIEVKTVYVAVRTARKKGWLSESVSGSAKGELTSEGHKEFKRVKGQTLYEQYIAGVVGSENNG